MAAVDISSAFDAGNIEVVDASDATKIVQLKVPDDPYTELEKKNHKQWFYFRAGGTLAGKKTTYSIVNAGQCAYPGAWPGTTVCYSYDRQEWKRCLDTAWDEATGALTWTHAAESNVVYYAYFAPYSHERHLDLLARCAAAPGVEVRSLGKTLDGRSLDLVELGNPEGSSVWVIHRQHPGESQAEWFAEGLLERLLARSDGLTLDLLKTCRFRIVPSMNPDGAFRGHLRVNAGGANLNREWGPTGDYAAPTLERSPEVLHTLGEMDRVGVDFFIDVHGDEELPYCFIAGSEGCPNWGPRLQGLQGVFTRSYNRANPDMQVEKSYEPDAPGEGNLAICSNQVAARFDCLSTTLEMPYKDCKTNPDPERGWSPARCKALGASLLDAIAASRPYLRTKEPFWEQLSTENQYIRPTAGGPLG